jgi:antitoxin (DNA-binding transcriptional repressor) of toxin-antitoxin stability system
MTDRCTEISDAGAEMEFEALVARAAAGETIIITRDGRPVARLYALPIYPDRGFGALDPKSEA